MEQACGGGGHKHGAYGQNRSFHPTASKSKARQVDSTSADVLSQDQSSATLRTGAIVRIMRQPWGQPLSVWRSGVIITTFAETYIVLIMYNELRKRCIRSSISPHIRRIIIITSMWSGEDCGLFNI